MSSLYQIERAIEEIINTGFIIDEETGEVMFDHSDLERLEVDYKKKVENIACYIKSQSAMANAIGDEIKALQARKKTLERKSERLEQYLTDSLNARDIAKIETVRARVSFRKSTSVEIIDEAKIDSKYKKEVVETKVDKKLLTQDLKEGAEIEGAKLVISQNIQIK